MCKLRPYVSQAFYYFLYYNSHVKPIIQYGVLVYGCTASNNLLPILRQQKKVFRIILGKHRWGIRIGWFFSGWKFWQFMNSMHMIFWSSFWEVLIKLTQTPLWMTYSQKFVYQRRTRNSNKGFLKIPRISNNLQRFSIQVRGSKLINFPLRKTIFWMQTMTNFLKVKLKF